MWCASCVHLPVVLTSGSYREASQSASSCMARYQIHPGTQRRCSSMVSGPSPARRCQDGVLLSAPDGKSTLFDPGCCSSMGAKRRTHRLISRACSSWGTGRLAVLALVPRATAHSAQLSAHSDWRTRTYTPGLGATQFALHSALVPPSLALGDAIASGQRDRAARELTTRRGSQLMSAVSLVRHGRPLM